MIVVYNRPNVHFAYGIKLIPGTNNVDPRLWEIAKKDQEIQLFIQNGVLTLPVADEKTKNPESTVTTLTEEERQKMEAKAFGDNREGINPNAPAEDLSELESILTISAGGVDGEISLGEQGFPLGVRLGNVHGRGVYPFLGLAGN